MRAGLFASSIVLFLVLVSSRANAEDIYYVQSVKAKVLSAPTFKAAALGEASRGARLAFLGKEGSWVKVSYYGKTGYVSSILVAPHPPLARVGLIKTEDAEFQQGVRRRASTYTSAAAARGLASDDRRRLSAEGEVDYAALEKIEALSVSDDDLVKFQKGGAL